MSDQKTFHLGLCMAGAVSAGAYTAGVIDYLIETLERWEEAKKTGDPSIPTHQIVIDVIGGASAGGMTSIIAGAAMQNPIGHITPDKRNDEAFKNNNKLYDSWVNLAADDMLPLMLKNDDIEKNNKVISLFNSDFIKGIADKAVTVNPNTPYPRPYLSDDADILVTLTNLQGIPYSLGFLGGVSKLDQYKTSTHRDFGHFALNKTTYKNDGRIPLSFLNNTNLDIAKNCAMATGAFPVGLSAREIQRDKQQVFDNRFINLLNEMEKKYNTNIPKSIVTDNLIAQKSFLHEIFDKLQNQNAYTTLNVDGGMLNNEPFEIIRDVIIDKTKEDRAANNNYDTCRSSILMIDPFPCEDPETDFDSSIGIMNVIKQTFKTMRGQLLFKPQDIEKAMDPKNISRFLIVPERENSTDNISGSMAIACGSFEGFGGFFDKSFRVHDYFLGRRNCQYFLQEWLTIPVDTTNPIFTENYSPEAKTRFLSKKGGLPIIPDTNKGNSNMEEKALDWPQIEASKVESWRKLFRERIKELTFRLTDLKGFDKFLLNIGYGILIGRKATDAVINMITNDLRKHKLIK
ncbi:patatin-like phospholipase family protein [Solitalea sp. MAHUQ-68]|uniref:Patatin-like phospholipase family protein n=1 Tax=Solitalea agri TaxID=2953739 RepID=A0A9X2F4U3_9SPHI|nr:patatin-like phospholipase family protein [Solitalea agri]MCO4292351.1 patatin-like phospholipase family protein [Solitalea agri]